MAKPRKPGRRRAKAAKKRYPDRTNLHWAVNEYVAHFSAVKPA